MIRICAWCNTVLGEKEPIADKRPTHTICVPCATAINPDFGREAEQIENNQTKENNICPTLQPKPN